jgi:hypothetical protein
MSQKESVEVMVGRVMAALDQVRQAKAEVGVLCNKLEPGTGLVDAYTAHAEIRGAERSLKALLDLLRYS